MFECFIPCLPKLVPWGSFPEHLFLEEGPSRTPESSIGTCRRRSVSLLHMSPQGILQAPRYRSVNREACPLLQYCWEENWPKVLSRIQSHPHETQCITQNSGRTALHLVTFGRTRRLTVSSAGTPPPGGGTHSRTTTTTGRGNIPDACPLAVVQALLQVNRHLVLMQDFHWYTPLHSACYFAFHDNYQILQCLCHTALLVQQELQGQGLPPTSGMSPLFLAAKRAASLETLQCLLATRRRRLRSPRPANLVIDASPLSSSDPVYYCIPQEESSSQEPQEAHSWIAPSTGGEPYWCETNLDEYSSPLEVLLRDRANIVFAKEEEEMPSPLCHSLRESARRRLSVEHGMESRYESAACNMDFVNHPREEVSETLDLWEKCLELLGEHVPLLETNSRDNTLDEISIAVNSTENDSNPFPFALVHTIVCAKVPIPHLLPVALAVFPEQALQRDASGLLPLHHVLLANHPYATMTLLRTLWQEAPSAIGYSLPDGSSPLLLALRQKLSAEVIWKYLVFAPSLSDNGETDNAMVTSTNNGHDTLNGGPSAHQSVVSCPLAWKDPKSGLYPFSVAAVQDYDTNMVYSLLRAYPQVLMTDVK